MPSQCAANRARQPPATRARARKNLLRHDETYIYPSSAKFGKPLFGEGVDEQIVADCAALRSKYAPLLLLAKTNTRDSCTETERAREREESCTCLPPRGLTRINFSYTFQCLPPRCVCTAQPGTQGSCNRSGGAYTQECVLLNILQVDVDEVIVGEAEWFNFDGYFCGGSGKKVCGG